MKKIISLVLVAVLAVISVFSDNWRVTNRSEELYPNGQFAGFRVTEEITLPIKDATRKTFRRHYIQSNDEFVGIILSKEFHDAIEEGELEFAGYEKLGWDDFRFSKFMDSKGITDMILEYEEVSIKDGTAKFQFYLFSKTWTNEASVQAAFSEIIPLSCLE